MLLRRAAILVITALATSCGSPEDAARTASETPPAHQRPATTQATTLHNVLQLTVKVISGSVPVGDAGFDELSAMGVRTIISVDGAMPDIARAQARGMRYVHLPVGYHGIEPDRGLALARAMRDLPGPIYLHCHHGRHRGPAAAAAAAIVLGEVTNESGIAFLRQAGTSENYTGLYACVLDSKAVGDDILDAAPADFPAVSPMPEFVKAMVAAQEAYDHLVEVRDAGWTVPEHHPDLVPIAEAGLLENLMRAMVDDPETNRYPPEFADLMRASHRLTGEFESALAAGQPHAELSRRLKLVGDSCRDCHVQFRDRR